MHDILAIYGFLLETCTYIPLWPNSDNIADHVELGRVLGEHLGQILMHASKNLH